MTDNIGSAILIIGAGYLYFVYHLNEWIVVGLALLAVISWVTVGFEKEREKLFEAQIEYYHAKANYYKKKADQK